MNYNDRKEIHEYCMSKPCAYESRPFGEFTIFLMKKSIIGNKGGTYIMEFISKEKIVELSNPGVVSRQLLNPENSSSERVTITEVHLEVGACQPRHTHDASEQIWYATKGTGKLLLADDKEKEFVAGDVVRFADKDEMGYVANKNRMHKNNDLQE